jgi:transcriptional regulator with XRE-family HTH domain
MTLRKIDDRLIERVKDLRAQGKTQEQIAGEIGITQGAVSRILRQAKGR